MVLCCIWSLSYCKVPCKDKVQPWFLSTSCSIKVLKAENNSAQTWEDGSANSIFEWYMEQARFTGSGRTNAWISILHCSTEGCPFYLEFQKNQDSEDKYVLPKKHNTHNNQLKGKDGGFEMTEEIEKKGYRVLTLICHWFPEGFIKRLRKDLQSGQPAIIECGSLTEDANELTDMLIEDKKKKAIFELRRNEADQLEQMCFITNRMLFFPQEFNEIFIIDTTFKTNRFGLSLLDTVSVNNFGQTRTMFVTLMPNSKQPRFDWAIDQFKKAYGVTLKVIFFRDFFFTCFIRY